MDDEDYMQHVDDWSGESTYIRKAVTQKSAPYGMWRMADGSLIVFSQMSDKHLINSIKILMRIAQDSLGNIQKSATRFGNSLNGDMAQAVFEQELEDIDEWDMWDVLAGSKMRGKFNQILKELRRRKQGTPKTKTKTKAGPLAIFDLPEVYAVNSEIKAFDVDEYAISIGGDPMPTSKIYNWIKEKFGYEY